MIAIVDYGVGNLVAIRNMLRKGGAEATIVTDPAVVQSAEKLILPGVGAFDYAVERLRDKGLLDVIRSRVVNDHIPVLGICLGMQLFTQRSDEGHEPGLGLILGNTVSFDRQQLGLDCRIPHMGWAEIQTCRRSRLLDDMPNEPRFYFVHSYHLSGTHPADVVATATHGYAFPAIIEHKNIVGVQFHPEKSHQYGMQLLKNFAERY